MGWDFQQGATKKDMIAYLTGDNGAGGRTLKRCCKGNTLWALHERSDGTKFIGCYLLSSRRGFGWGYKDMCEAMGPYYYNCPLAYLDEAPVANAEWRASVRAHHERLARVKALQVGEIWKLMPGYKPSEVTITSVKPLRGEASGTTYRIRKAQLHSKVA